MGFEPTLCIVPKTIVYKTQWFLGQASLWSLDTTSGQFVSHNFGPYTGWTATALSGGH